MRNVSRLLRLLFKDFIRWEDRVGFYKSIVRSTK